jgi:hypothetical protein
MIASNPGLDTGHSDYCYGILGFINRPNLFGRKMALGSTQTLTEMSIKNLPGGRECPAGA